MNINPQDWHNTRQVDFIPAHFIKFKFRPVSEKDRLKLFAWIEQNCIGRFGLGIVTQRIDGKVGSSAIIQEKYIGFEESADATMYGLFYK